MFWEREACGGRRRAGASRRWRAPARLYRLTTLSRATAPRERVMILRAATDELRGFAVFREREASSFSVFSSPARGRAWSRVAACAGATTVAKCTRLAVPGFSPRRRAARLCQDMAGILLDASLLRDARAPFRSAPRLARRFYCPMAFLGLSAYEDARALGRRRRVSWGLDYHFNGLSRTNLRRPNTGFCLELCQAAKN